MEANARSRTGFYDASGRCPDCRCRPGYHASSAACECRHHYEDANRAAAYDVAWRRHLDRFHYVDAWRLLPRELAEARAAVDALEMRGWTRIQCSGCRRVIKPVVFCPECGSVEMEGGGCPNEGGCGRYMDVVSSKGVSYHRKHGKQAKCKRQSGIQAGVCEGSTLQDSLSGLRGTTNRVAQPEPSGKSEEAASICVDVVREAHRSGNSRKHPFMPSLSYGGGRETSGVDQLCDGSTGTHTAEAVQRVRQAGEASEKGSVQQVQVSREVLLYSTGRDKPRNIPKTQETSAKGDLVAGGRWRPGDDDCYVDRDKNGRPLPPKEVRIARSRAAGLARGQQLKRDPAHQRAARSRVSTESLRAAGRKGAQVTAERHGQGFLLDLVRQYRREHPTRVERSLHALLDQIGYPYETEVPVGNLSIDCADLGARWGIEARGGIHDVFDTPEHEAGRAEIIRADGWEILVIEERDLVNTCGKPHWAFGLEGRVRDFITAARERAYGPNHKTILIDEEHDFDDIPF